MEGEQQQFPVVGFLDRIIQEKAKEQDVKPGDYVYLTRTGHPGVMKGRVEKESDKTFSVRIILDEFNEPFVADNPKEQEVRRGKEYVSLIKFQELLERVKEMDGRSRSQP